MMAGCLFVALVWFVGLGFGRHVSACGSVVCSVRACVDTRGSSLEWQVMLRCGVCDGTSTSIGKAVTIDLEGERWS
jgi:hypothetical protein